MSVNTVTGEITEAPLSAMERSTLTHAEAKIERGLASFVEVGEALAEVRDARLYRETHATFLDYCRDRWGISDSRARQLIGAAETVTTVTTLGAPAPSNEGQARALSGLEPDAAAEAMQRAHEATGGNVTAAAIRAARNPHTPEPVEEGEADAGSGQTPQGEAAPGDDARRPVPSDSLPRPAVTGIDGKTYPKPKPKKPARKPLADAFFRIAYDLGKKAESLHRLIEDDRWPQNAEKVATAHRNDLLRINDLLQQVINSLPENEVTP